MRKPSEVVFGDDNLEREFNKLNDNDEIKKYIGHKGHTRKRFLRHTSA